MGCRMQAAEADRIVRLGNERRRASKLLSVLPAEVGCPIEKGFLTSELVTTWCSPLDARKVVSLSVPIVEFRRDMLIHSPAACDSETGVAVDCLVCIDRLR
jgi:hypothetical protein